jgi:hypothetical protein
MNENNLKDINIDIYRQSRRKVWHPSWDTMFKEALIVATAHAAKIATEMTDDTIWHVAIANVWKAWEETFKNSISCPLGWEPQYQQIIFYLQWVGKDIIWNAYYAAKNKVNANMAQCLVITDDFINKSLMVAEHCGFEAVRYSSSTVDIYPSGFQFLDARV